MRVSDVPTVATMRALIRARLAVDVAEALYRVEKCSKHAKLEDVPIPQQAIYHQTAEQAVDTLLRAKAEGRR